MSISPLSFTLIILYCELTFVSIYIGLVFLFKTKHIKESGIELSPFLGLTFFFLFYGVSQIFFVYRSYVDLEIPHVFVSQILGLGGYLTGFTGIIALVFFSEKVLGKTKYIITIITTGAVLYGLLFIPRREDLQFYSGILIPTSMLIVGISFFYTFIYKTKGEVRKKLIIGLVFLAGFLVSYLVSLDIGEFIFRLPYQSLEIISVIGSIITLIGLGIVFLSFETFTEIGWQEKIKELFIIAPNGATLFHYSFIKTTDSQDPDLITSGLTGIKELLGEMVQSKQNLKIVDHQDVKIIFEYGTYSTLALITFENLRIYHSKLALLIKEFENLYQDILSNWSGELKVFHPSIHLIEEIFG